MCIYSQGKFWPGLPARGTVPVLFFYIYLRRRLINLRAACKARFSHFENSTIERQHLIRDLGAAFWRTDSGFEFATQLSVPGDTGEDVRPGRGLSIALDQQTVDFARTSSLGPPKSEQITGVPAAKASRTTRGPVSIHCDGTAKKSN